MTQVASNPWCNGRRRLAALAVLLGLILNGCNSQKPPIYENKQGFRFTPPPGWVQRASDDALPSTSGHREPNLPLPHLSGERLLVRYDRLTAGYLAWLRVTLAELSPSTPLKTCVCTRLPRTNWKRESDVETLEVSGLPAARVAFVGRWSNQDYLSETVAVRQEERVYFITASFPASDSIAREQVRHAVASAAWH